VKPVQINLQVGLWAPADDVEHCLSLFTSTTDSHTVSQKYYEAET